MPMFELDAGRPAPVQPMQPAAGAFDTDSTSVVAEHLGSLLGEPLFPVARRRPGSSDDPHLLAMDAAGQPVVVEVVQVLDAAALTRSLRFAGAAARMSSVDLARAYGPGPDRFAADLVAFRETVPVSVAHAAARHGGARLLLVCSEVAESVVDAVEFLRGQDRRIDVLQLGVVRGPDGRRFVEVSPLVARVPSRRPVEPSVVRVVTPGDPADAAARATTPREQLAGSTAPAGTFPSVLPVPVGGGAEPPTPDPVARPTRDDTPTGPVEVVAAPPEDADAEPAVPPVPTVENEPHEPEQTEDEVDVPDEAAPDAGPGAPDEPPPDEVDVSGEADTERGTETDADTAADPSTAGRPEPVPALAALAERLGGTTTLVWTRLRRGQRFVAVLRRDGLLQLPDGSVHADPDAAATAVADAESSVDGWRAWHVGDDGPSLADAREA